MKEKTKQIENKFDSFFTYLSQPDVNFEIIIKRLQYLPFNYSSYIVSNT